MDPLEASCKSPRPVNLGFCVMNIGLRMSRISPKPLRLWYLDLEGACIHMVLLLISQEPSMGNETLRRRLLNS